MSKHTPGPWEARYWEREAWPQKRVSIAEKYGEGAALFINAKHGKNTAANAQLIAAAPEMLEALEETVYMRGIPEDDEARNGYEKRLMAAIAKAKGDTG